MKIMRLSVLVPILLLGLLIGSIHADIRLPLPPPAPPKDNSLIAPEKAPPRPSSSPEKAPPEPPSTPAKVDIEVPPPPALPETQPSTTSVVMAGGFLAMAIVVFGLVVFRSRKTPPKLSE